MNMANKAELSLRKRLKEKYGNEYVMVIDNEDIPISFREQAFVHSDKGVLDFFEHYSQFILRYEAEYNPIYRQPIPYVIIKINGEYFATKRLSGSGESRLVEQISLGIGGHINPCDILGNRRSSVFENSIHRELHEELFIPEGVTYNVDFVGIINDMSNPVSRDHIGLLYIANLKVECDKDIQVKETEKLEGLLLSIEDIEMNFKKLESWSKIVYTEVLKDKEIGK